MKVLIFDTETTGLPIGRNPSIFDTSKWPHIVQLSYIVYDTNDIKLITCKDYIIKVDESVVISDESINIHGITRSMCNRKGIQLRFALDDFNEALKSCDWVVGHNISFDKRMIMVESNRLQIPQYFTNIAGHGKKEYCTMKNSVELCKIVTHNKSGQEYYKYPKLQELHEKLFETTAKGTHDSMGDVLICLRCYGKMVHNHDIVNKGSTKLRNLFKLYCL